MAIIYWYIVIPAEPSGTSSHQPTGHNSPDIVGIMIPSQTIFPLLLCGPPRHHDNAQFNKSGSEFLRLSVSGTLVSATHTEERALCNPGTRLSQARACPASRRHVSVCQSVFIPEHAYQDTTSHPVDPFPKTRGHAEDAIPSEK